MINFSVIFVCTENICRSPMAEVALRHYARAAGYHKRIHVGSAGTHCSVPGHKPDQRAVRVLSSDGVRLKGVKARRIMPADFEKYDVLLAMDLHNKKHLLEGCPGHLQYKIRLLAEYLPESPFIEIPDPYYGSMSGFEEVSQLIQQACQVLLTKLIHEMEVGI